MQAEHTGWHLQVDKLAEGRLNLIHTAHTSRRPSCAVLEPGMRLLAHLKIYSEEICFHKRMFSQTDPTAGQGKEMGRRLGLAQVEKQ